MAGEQPWLSPTVVPDLNPPLWEPEAYFCLKNPRWLLFLRHSTR